MRSSSSRSASREAVRFRVASPRDVALAMLDARFGTPQPVVAADGLAAFQQDALARVTRILQCRHGAILADSVGLGKTHVAAALIRSVTADGGRVLVTGPAMLQAHWRRHLRHVRRWRWCSHTSLSRGGAPAGTSAWKLVVVDEAHAFRNPETHRYRALARLCAGADVLLLTATPVNNTLLDLYWLIRLFASDAAFHDVGVPDMRGAFDAAARAADARDVRRIAETVLVRRTRALVRQQYGTGELGLRFPEAVPVRALPYALEDDVAALLEHLTSLRFPAHSLLRDASATALLRMGLLKRLESGHAALRASLRRHLRVVTAFESALRDGFLLDAREYRTLAAEAEDATQLLLDAAVLRRTPPGWDSARAYDDAAHDRALLQQMLRVLDAARADPKLAALRTLLDGELHGERVLVFTEFRETATAIWRGFRDGIRCALIHGSCAYLGSNHSGRRAVIERFAPFANGVRAPPARERVDVLIATDVLAEGLNLQDARVVVSYDLPWNPVRLAQRIGRVDRLGSPHDTIDVVTFAPDQRLETLLGLMRRLRRKLRAIRLVGGDAPTLARATHPNASRMVSRPEWEIVEQLRAEHRRARTDARLDAPIAVLAGLIEWDEPQSGVLCCTTRGDVARLCLVLNASGIEGDIRIDRALLQALGNADVANPDETRLRRGARVAKRTLEVDALPRRGADSTRRAATLVHRWLASRSLAADDDYTRADRLLTRLRYDFDPHLQQELGDVIGGSGSLDERIERLEAAVARAPPLEDTRAQRLIAALELRPRPRPPTS